LQSGIEINANGLHYSGTAFQLDGTENRDPILGTIVVIPTLESVAEMKITAQNYDAEFGQALAGIVILRNKANMSFVCTTPVIKVRRE
jgi:hypothetical protein